MSVAFRREGDEEHLEPKFEIPIPPGPNWVTPRGATLIRSRIAEIEARIAGLSGDDEIKSAKRDLRYWQTREVTAELVADASGEKVEIGTRVTFRMGGKQRSLGIVGDDEADPAASLISYAAPLARALMGAEVGDVLEFGGKDDAIEGVSGVMNLVMVPMWIFSGIFFSTERFPDALQPFVQALPLTALNDALRGVMLEGASFAALSPELLILAAWGAVSFGLALKFFRWQ